MAHNHSNGHIPTLTQTAVQGLTAIHDLDAEQLAEIWARRAYELAKPPVAENPGESLELLTFLLCGARYGLEVTYIREILRVTAITPVPRTPDFVVGISNARGRLISVIDLHAFWGLPPLTCLDRSKIIVAALADLEVGLLADNVSEMTSVSKDDLEPVLLGQDDHLQGITDKMLMILDLPAVFSDPRFIINEALR